MKDKSIKDYAEEIADCITINRLNQREIAEYLTEILKEILEKEDPSIVE